MVLYLLAARPKWHGTSKVRLDDVVLFRYDDCDKTGWKIGRVVEILKKGELRLSYSCQPVLSKSQDPNFTLAPLKTLCRRMRDVTILVKNEYDSLDLDTDIAALGCNI